MISLLSSSLVANKLTELSRDSPSSSIMSGLHSPLAESSLAREKRTLARE